MAISGMSLDGQFYNPGGMVTSFEYTDDGGIWTKHSLGLWLHKQDCHICFNAGYPDDTAYRPHIMNDGCWCTSDKRRGCWMAAAFGNADSRDIDYGRRYL